MTRIGAQAVWRKTAYQARPRSEPRSVRGRRRRLCAIVEARCGVEWGYRACRKDGRRPVSHRPTSHGIQNPTGWRIGRAPCGCCNRPVAVAGARSSVYASHWCRAAATARYALCPDGSRGHLGRLSLQNQGRRTLAARQRIDYGTDFRSSDVRALYSGKDRA